MAAPAVAQVSPGPLARPHAPLEGPLQCRKCHGAAKEEMDGKCLACHEGIAWLKERHRGVHGQAGLGACASCHPDHAGSDFEMIDWGKDGRERFDHARAGWRLDGKHATLTCDACHRQTFRVSEAAKLEPPPKDASRRLTGLDPACRSCHEEKDVHRGALGDDCSRCHVATAWKSVASFDHSKTAYPLLGRHATVPCASCHESPKLSLARDAGGRTIPVYKPLPHAECSDCHADPHEARLGPACASCHGVEDFHRVATGGFQHDRTRFPLKGAHRTVACAACHDPKTAWGKRPAFGACADCHKDPHNGQATIAARRVDCAACHSADAWRPSTYTAAQHAASAYPLEGKHRAVGCAACHVKNPPGVAAATLGKAGVLMRPKHARCRDCHAQAHGDQLAARADKGACEPCHTTAGWKPSLFTAAQHRALRLPLDGAHATIACAACHGPKRQGLPPLPDAGKIGAAGVAFALAERECIDCHRDPHAPAVVKASKETPVRSCADCHDARAFIPSTMSADAHQRFGFPLEGGHRAVPCALCHADMKAPPSTRAPGWTLARASQPGRRVVFRQGSGTCADCHRDPHAGQFARREGGGACEICHGVDSFRPASRFDHDRDASFALKGAHARVPCVKCHAPQAAADGSKRTIYKPVPSRCEDCHAGKARAS